MKQSEFKAIETGVVGGYKKIEDGVMSGYKKMEESVVDGFGKISDRFVDRFLTKDGETVEEAKARLAEEQAAREEKQAAASGHGTKAERKQSR